MKSIKLVLILFSLLISNLLSQTTDFNALLVVNPTPSPYLSDWQNNPTLGRFVLTYTGSAPVSFSFYVRITSPQYGELISANSSPIDWMGATTQVYTPYDVISLGDGVKNLKFNNSMKERIVRSGRFPEGDFELEVSVKSIVNGILTTVTTSTAPFSIIYPAPPQLILPQNETVVTNSYPTFQWSILNVPPTMPVTYKIKIVERLANQTPSRALEANPVHHIDSVVGIGLYTYPPSGLPFETSKEYVWQISSTDAEGNALTTNNGKSEIWQFYWGTVPSPGGLPFDSLTIVEGYAYLINLRQVSFTEDNNSYTFNGNARLILKFNGSDIPVTVRLQNLSVQKGMYTPPMFLGGTFSATLPPDAIPSSVVGDFFRATLIEFSQMDGLTLGGVLNLPGLSSSLPLTGRLTLGIMGLSGSLNVERTGASPLYTLGQSISRLLITQASVHFSEPQVRLGGVLEIFGVRSNCLIDNLVLDAGGNISGTLSCDLNANVPLIPNSNRLEMRFRNIAGEFNANIGNSSFVFNIRATAGLDFRATDTSSYGADLVVTIANTGFNLVSFTPRGNITPPALDLGWIRLALSNLNLSSLSYSGGNWNFAMGMDVQIVFPMFENLTLPTLNGASLGTNGLTLPSINLSSLNLPRFNFALMQFEMLNASMPAVTIPFFGSGSNATTGMRFDFDFRMRLQNLPGGELRDRVINITNASFNNGQFSATLQPLSFPDPGVSFNFTNEITFKVRELSGSIAADFRGSTPSINPNIRIRGKLGLMMAMSGLDCPPGTDEINMMSTSLNLSGDGKISGRIENIDLGCGLNLNPLRISFSNVALDFNFGDDGQRLNIEGAINAQMPNPSGGVIQGSGTINYDLFSNTLISLVAEIRDPFTINIPSTSPVISFQVPRARITRESIILDGRSFLVLGGGTNIGVTFRNFNLRWRDMNITSGDVVFDSPFAFKVTLENGGLRFRAVPVNSQLTEQIGIMLNLPGSFSLGANGFRANGNSIINLRYNNNNYDSLRAVFSEDFAMSVSPFSVTAGQVEFFLQNRRVAFINSSGFSPDMNYFAAQLLPERIPLPVQSVGYLKIKEGDNFLIDYSNFANGVRLQTRSGQPIKLVLPALRCGRPTNPELDVNFDIIINPQTLQLTSGSINVAIPANQQSNWDLSQFGIPFNVTNINYAELQGGLGFQLEGNLKAFGNSLGDPVNLTIFADGRLTGDIDLTLNRNIQLVPGSDKLNFSVSRITSSFDLQLSPLNLVFDISMTGGIRLNLGEGRNYGASATIRVSNNGINVDNFVVDNPSEMPRLDFSWLNMGLSHFTIPRLEYDPDNGWDFEIRLNAHLNFPGLNFQLPPINGITIRKTGFTIPAYSIPEISDSFRNFHGFGIKPLAFRMQQFSFNWFTMQGTSLSDWGFGFDFELGFSQMPASVPEVLRNTRVRILNAGFNNGRITGNIQVRDFNAPGIQLPLGGSTNFLIRRIGGSLTDNGTDQDIIINIGGDIQLPEFMRCSGSSGVTSVGTMLTIDSRGMISGRINNFIPQCPIDLGIGKFAVSNSSLDFSFGGPVQRAIIELAGALKLPPPSGTDSISVEGDITFNLLNGAMLDGQIAINQPFRWQIPSQNPVLVFTINNAVLNHLGLRINGQSSLNLGGGQSLVTNFENFLFDFKELRVTSGTARFMGQFALKFVVESGGLRWSAIPGNQPVTEPTVVRLQLPNNITLSTEGLGASGQSFLLVRVGGREYANVRAEFSNDFLIRYSPFGVARGNVRFFYNETLAGVLDRDGFRPGDILGMLPLPEKLPLPDSSIAYLVIKQGNNVLVQTEPVQNGIRISTRPGERVRLVMPGLKFSNPTAPEVLISFSITVNTTTFALVDGSISVSPTPGSTSIFSLANLGIPLHITNLAFERMSGGPPTLRASARLVLPAALNSAVVTMDSMVINQNGFSGILHAGEYNTRHVPGERYLATIALGSSASLKIGGISAVINNSSTNIRMSGDIGADIFRNSSGQQTPLHWFAIWESGRFNFTFDMTHVPGMQIPLLFANFRPQSIGGSPAFSLDVSSSSFALTLSGVLSIPSISDQFSVSFAGLRIANTGITIPNVSINTPNQNFNLFGAQFALRNISNFEQAISFAYTNRILYLTLNGDVTLFGNTSQFRGLKFGSDGSMSINQANLITRDVPIVQNYLGISRISLANSAMRVDGYFKLPKPADTTRQTFNFTINSQGQVTGGANISILNENAGIGGGDRTEWDFWIAKFDLTYVRLNLNLSNFRTSSLEVISDIYFMNDVNKYIRIGYKQGGAVNPGLRVGFDGSVRWGNIQISNSLANIDFQALKLNLTQATLNSTSNNFQLALTGRLTIGLDGVSGGLNFSNLRISSNGGIENLAQSITGGSFSIANVVTLTVSNIGFSSTRTQIWVKTGVASVDSQSIYVENYFRFGASISIANVASGGIEEFLMYKTASGVTSLTIRNANLSVPGVLTFRADLLYKREASGFYLTVGGKGRLMNSFEVKLMGKVSNRGGQTSFGVFVAATGLNITIPPAIVLTGVGGGFFYNPDPADISLVRQLCGLDGTTMGSVNASPGRFAVLIYAEASIISGTMVRGKILLTIAQNYFELRGQVVLLGQTNSLYGNIYLFIGSGRAQGNISVTIRLNPILTGTASVGFYVVGSNTWGIYGTVNVRLLSIVSANSDFFVGSPGFYFGFDVNVRIDICAILRIDAGFGAKIWRFNSTGVWGAYGYARCSVEIFSINFGSVAFTGAILGGNNSLIYGEVAVDCGFLGTARAWGEINNGSTRGGLGGNEARRNQINAAITTAQNMLNQKNSIVGQLR